MRKAASVRGAAERTADSVALNGRKASSSVRSTNIPSPPFSPGRSIRGSAQAFSTTDHSVWAGHAGDTATAGTVTAVAANAAIEEDAGSSGRDGDGSHSWIAMVAITARSYWERVGIPNYNCTVALQ